MNKEQVNEQVMFTGSNGEEFKIPESGSLGLLALGYQGLVAWRSVKNNSKDKKAKDGQKAG